MRRKYENGRSGAKRSLLTILVWALALFLVVPAMADAEILYVDAGASGNDDGTSWADAYVSLALALDDAVSGDEVWVAAGAYRPEFDVTGSPVPADVRSKTFLVRGGVAVYGGFAGTETGTEERDIEANPTVLTGDIDFNDTTGEYDIVESADLIAGDNVFHLVTVSGDEGAVLDGLVVTGGRAGDDEPVDYPGYGGGVINLASGLTVRKCIFSGNYANNFGGGMCNYKVSGVTVTGCTFTGNRTLSSFGGGGGGGLVSFAAEVVVAGCTFRGNATTDGWGGGLLLWSDAHSEVSDCLFADNSCAPDDYYGGGMAIVGDLSAESYRPEVRDCVFEGNSLRGLTSTYARPSVTRCTFKDNDGSGLEISNSGESTDPPSVVEDCAFQDNRTDGDGAGLYLDAASPRVTGCVFSGNCADFSGGAIYNRGSNPVVANCTFSGNAAGTVGGGMSTNWGGSPVLTNCTFSGNTAGESGGALFNWNASWTGIPCLPVIANCTFVGNSAGGTEEGQGGGGMYNRDASPTVTNCIFWNEGNEIVNEDEESVPTLSHCVVRGGGVGAGTVSEDIFTGDPELLPLADNGGSMQTVAFLTGSSALDAGVPVDLEGIVLSADQRGVPRPQRDAWDIGAYEADQWYTVTLSGDEGGTVSAEPWGLITESADFTLLDTPTFVITPLESMDLAGLWLDGASRDFSAEGASLTLDPLSGDHSLRTAFTVKTFTISGAVSGDHGNITESITVDWGQDADVVVSADAHYHIDWIAVDGMPLSGVVGEKNYSLTVEDVRGDVVVTAGFAVDRHTVTVNYSGAGTGSVTLASDGGIHYGSEVTLNATADPNSIFGGWRDVDWEDGARAGVFIDGDRAVTALFDLKSFTVTASAGAGGSVSPAEASVLWGQGHIVTITPDPGYAVSDVTVDGVSIGARSSYTFENVTEEGHLLSATFSPVAVILDPDEFASDPEGALFHALDDVADGGTVRFHESLSGGSIVLSDELILGRDVNLAAPSGGFTLSGGGTHRVLHVEDGAEVSLEGFTVCNGDVGEEDGGGIFNDGILSLLNCTFSGNRGLWGSAIANGPGAVLRISHCTVSGNSDAAIFGHGGAILEVNGSIVAGNGKYDIASTPSACLSGGHNLVGVVPNLEEVFSCGGDRILPDVTAEELFLGPLAVYGGGSPTLALKTGSPALDVGAALDLDGNVVRRDQRGVPRPQSGGCDIGAYEAERFTVTVPAMPGGTVSTDPYGVIEGAADFTELDRPAFVITPEKGWELTGLRLDGEPCSFDAAGATLTLEPLSADHTLEAVFTAGAFTITATAGPGGSVDPITASVPCGQDHTVTITPKAGYVMADVTADGQSVGAVSSHTFHDVRENHTLTARFAPDPNAGGVEDLDVTDGGSALIVITEGTSGLDLPDGASFDRVGSSDVTGSAEMRGVDSDDVRDVLSGAEPEGTFLTGSSFDVAAEDTLAWLDSNDIGILPLDVTLEVPRAKLTPACLEAIERAGAEAGLEGAFLGEVEIFKVTEGKAYDLFDVVLDARHDPEDFFAVSRDEAGDFHVGLKLLIADAPSEGVPAVQAVVASGDCRFLVFDGNRDGHFVDPLVAVEKPHGSGGGGDGCSVGSAMPWAGILLAPLMLLRIRK